GRESRFADPGLHHDRRHRGLPHLEERGKRPHRVVRAGRNRLAEPTLDLDRAQSESLEERIELALPAGRPGGRRGRAGGTGARDGKGKKAGQGAEKARPPTVSGGAHGPLSVRWACPPCNVQKGRAALPQKSKRPPMPIVWIGLEMSPVR